jgi:hypothetical protein
MREGAALDANGEIRAVIAEERLKANSISRCRENATGRRCSLDVRFVTLPAQCMKLATIRSKSWHQAAYRSV